MMGNGRVIQSPNYHKGAFRNRENTPVMAPEVSFFKLLRDVVNRPAGIRPSQPIPSVKTDLKSLYSEEPVIIWFGHSSYLIHCNGLNILVDPVFSGHASPLSFMIRAFPGSDVYKTEDLPDIDFVIITHDHYDHLDKETIRKLGLKTNTFYTSLGVGSRLENFSVAGSEVTEMDWWQSIQISDNIQLTATPARHFSGRWIKRGGSLWSSFVLEIFGYRLFLGGDSGYGNQFKEIGARFSSFDLAILECGQYNTSWPFIHMMPEEAVQASIDLGAKVFMPVHWGKFSLANHLWNEPVNRAFKVSADLGVKITAPLIGEPVIIGRNYPDTDWWNL